MFLTHCAVAPVIYSFCGIKWVKAVQRILQ